MCGSEGDSELRIDLRDPVIKRNGALIRILIIPELATLMTATTLARQLTSIQDTSPMCGPEVSDNY